MVESQNSGRVRQVTHRAAEESQRRGRWRHNISWRESQRQLKRVTIRHRATGESHREASGDTDQLKRVTERQVEPLNS